MIVTNPYIPNILFDAGGLKLAIKKIDIGVWNMQTTDQKQVNHGLTAESIIQVAVFIRNDPGLGYRLYPLQTITGATPPASFVSGIIDIFPAYISMYRWDTSIFDTADFNDAVVNRGYIVIWYTY